MPRFVHAIRTMRTNCELMKMIKCQKPSGSCVWPDICLLDLMAISIQHTLRLYSRDRERWQDEMVSGSEVNVESRCAKHVHWFRYREQTGSARVSILTSVIFGVKNRSRKRRPTRRCERKGLFHFLKKGTFPRSLATKNTCCSRGLMKFADVAADPIRTE